MELGFAAITPRSMASGRTGGIIARLLGDPRIEFVGARMYAPSEAFVNAFVRIMPGMDVPENFREPYRAYVEYDLRPGNTARRGYPNDMLVLFFRGEDVTGTMRAVIGPHGQEPTGANIRGTFGEYTVAVGGAVHMFHPAVLSAFTPETNRAFLQLLATYAEKDGGVLAPDPRENRKVETTLVMVKPDNLDHPSTLPGNIIDRFGLTGLRIVGAKLVSMSVDMGMEFYGFLEGIFVEKLAFLVELKLHERLALAFDFEITEEEFTAMTDVLKRKNAHTELCKIVHYMSGIHPDSVRSKKERAAPGPAKCFALLFQGPSAIEKIRDTLGATDPTKAAFATIRADYGNSLMRNGAHASDSVPSAERERKIVGLTGTERSEEKKTIQAFLKNGHA